MNDGLCDLGEDVTGILFPDYYSLFFGDTSSSDADTNTDTAENVQEDEDTNDDNDCFNGQTPQQAALAFAWFAQMYWVAGKVAAGNRNHPITTAFTIVKEGSECKGYIALSNSFGRADAGKNQLYDLAWTGINALAEVPPTDEVIGNPIPNTIRGVDGHAERLLYNELGARIKAMGISQAPCPDGDDSCAAWFRSEPASDIKVAYWDRGRGPVAFE
mgnify:CR=1 FL=1